MDVEVVVQAGERSVGERVLRSMWNQDAEALEGAPEEALGGPV